MTSNHILLYHLAELMLKREQHQLSVDLLFDDNQIGDFVKSIQIDSPYQQMLLEGVLTESVREEKLYVTFTIEGYFHYVLGEVIYNQTEGKGAEVLKQMVEENKLNGLKEGIEQCLIRDVNQDDLSRLMWLIDSGGELLDLCSKPLAHTFLNIKGQINSEEELTKAYSEQISRVTNELFADPTDNDIEALSRGINYLEETQKNKVLALIYQQINELIVPDNLKKSILYVKSIKHLLESVRNSKLQNLTDYQIKEESDLASSFYNSFGEQFFFVGNYDKAIESFEKSLAIRLKVHGDQHSSTGESYNNLGLMWSYKGEFDKAIEYYEKSLAIRLKVHGDQYWSTGETYNNLGLVWSKKGEYDKAIAYYEKSLAIKLKVHGNQHPSTGISYNNLGLVRSKKGDCDKAIEYHEKSLAIRLKVHGDQHPSTRLSYNNLGSVWSKKGDYYKAIEYYEKSLEIDLKVHGDQHPSTRLSYNNLGSVWFKKGEYDKAIEYNEKSLAITLKVDGDQHPSTGVSYNNLGFAWSKNGEYDKALEYYEKSLAIRLRVYGDRHPSIGESYNNLGNVFKEKKDLIRAKEYFSKAYTIFFESLGQLDAQTQLLSRKLNDL